MTCDKGRKGHILTANMTEAELISPIRKRYVIKAYLLSSQVFGELSVSITIFLTAQVDFIVCSGMSETCNQYFTC